jgi:hypothetical protein
MAPVAWFSYSVEFHEVWPINVYIIHAFTTEITSKETDRPTDTRRLSVRFRSNSEERKQSGKGLCSISYFWDLRNQFDIMKVFFLISWGGVRLSPLGMSVANWPILSAPDDRRCVWSSRWNENWQGKNLPWRNFVHHKSHMTWLGIEPGKLRWETGD